MRKAGDQPSIDGSAAAAKRAMDVMMMMMMMKIDIAAIEAAAEGGKTDA
jgi:hypothetical protein